MDAFPIPRGLGSLCAAGALFLAAVPAAVPAQPPSRQPVPVVAFRYAESDSGAPQRMLKIRVEIAPGWHINSDAPLDEFLVPTTLEAKAEGYEFGKPKFPAPKRVRSDAAGGDMLLFSGAFEVEVPVLKPAVVPGAKAGKVPPRTRVVLRYQACDHSTCFPPKETVVEG